jgi:hypothetical protein
MSTFAFFKLFAWAALFTSIGFLIVYGVTKRLHPAFRCVGFAIVLIAVAVAWVLTARQLPPDW